MGKQATPSKFGEKQAGATAKFVRVPPRKARLVVDAVRGKYVSDALAILKFVPNFAARAIEDVIESAVANAENGRPISEETGKQLPPLIVDNLRLVRAFIDEGPRIKRLQPRAQGRAYRIVKRMCHISVIVEEVLPKPKPARKPKPKRVLPAAKTAAKPAAAKKAAPKKVDEKPVEELVIEQAIAEEAMVTAPDDGAVNVETQAEIAEASAPAKDVATAAESPEAEAEAAGEAEVETSVPEVAGESEAVATDETATTDEETIEAKKE